MPPEGQISWLYNKDYTFKSEFLTTEYVVTGPGIPVYFNFNITVVPVSYTHLDVYKRQVCCGATEDELLTIINFLQTFS